MTTQEIAVGGYSKGFSQTHRTDRWWIGPLLTFLGFSSFIVYSTWAALQGNHYFYGSYLSPFFCPTAKLRRDAPRLASTPST